MKVIETKAYNGKRMFLIYCLACGRPHGFNENWKFDDNFNNPTVGSSLGVNKRDTGGFDCHSTIANGMITYHGDSLSHSVRGTIPLPDFPDKWLPNKEDIINETSKV